MDPILEQEKVRLEGEQAKQILANPLFKRLSIALRDSYRDAWEQEADPDVRENLWYQLDALNTVMGELHQHIYTAAQQSEEANERTEPH